MTNENNENLGINDTKFDELREIIQDKIARLFTNLQIRIYLIEEFDIGPELAKKFVTEERAKWDKRDKSIDRKTERRKIFDGLTALQRNPNQKDVDLAKILKQKNDILQDGIESEERDPEEFAQKTREFLRCADRVTGASRFEFDTGGLYDPVVDENDNKILLPTKEQRDVFEAKRFVRYVKQLLEERDDQELKVILKYLEKLIGETETVSEVK